MFEGSSEANESRDDWFPAAGRALSSCFHLRAFFSLSLSLVLPIIIPLSLSLSKLIFSFFAQYAAAAAAGPPRYADSIEAGGVLR